MPENLGSANLEFRVDLEKFQGDLKAALSLVKQTLSEMKQGLNINVDNINFEPLKNDLKSLPSLADNVKDSVNNSLNSFAKFEIITGVINQVKAAFGELKSYVMDLGKEYADAELVQNKLQAGLERIGAGDFYNTLIKQAEDLHKITPFDDQDITNMQAMMTTFDGISGALIERLTPSMLNLASAFSRAGDTGMNLQNLAIMIGKSGATEMSGALQRVGIVMDETTKSMWKTYTAAERFAAMETLLANNSSITAEAFGKTLAGQIEITKNAFGDIKEYLGKAFAPVILEICKAVQGLAEWFGTLSPAIQTTIGLIGALAIAAVALIPILSALNIELGGLPIIIGAVIAAIGGIAIYISENIDSIRAWVTSMAGGEDAINNLKQTISTLWEGLKDLWSFVVDEFSGAWDELKTNMSGVIDMFKGSGDGGSVLLDVLKDLAKNGFELLKVIVNTAIEAFLKINKIITDLIIQNPQILEALKVLGGVGFAGVIWYANAVIDVFKTLIGWASNVANAVIAVAKALNTLSDISIDDIIFNPSRWRAHMDQIEGDINRIGNAFRNQDKDSKGGKFEDPVRQALTGAETATNENNTQPPGGGQKKKKGSGKDKEELDALKELTAEYDSQVKIMDEQLKRGDASVAQMNELLTKYREQLDILIPTLTKADDIRKANEKIESLKTKQLELEKSLSDEQKKAEKDRNALISDVDKFLEKRQAKVLHGIDKETADIELAYKEMERKVTESKVSEDEKKFQSEKLLNEKTKELSLARIESQKSLDEELKSITLKNSNDEYAIAKDNIEKKYQKEKERIVSTYAESVSRSDLLKQKDLERIKEVAKIETESNKVLKGILTNGFSDAISQIENSFSNMWNSVFGEARSIFQIFIKDVTAELTKLAASKFFESIGNFLLPGISSIFGFLFDGGGYTGDGDPKEPAGIVHKKEYVVGEKGTAFTANRYWLDIMNKGNDIGKYFANATAGFNLQVPVLDIPASFGSPSGSKSIVVNPGISLQVNSNRITGLSDSEWNQIVDEMIPKISEGLRRINKDTLDGTI